MDSASPSDGQQSGEGQIFPFRFERSYALASRPFGITPQNSYVRLRKDALDARFGRWSVETPVSNIRSWAITGPYHFLKTAGPARLAITDRGLTFATNSQRGLVICFHEPVAGMNPLRHPELTVTVADVEGLAEALGSIRNSS